MKGFITVLSTEEYIPGVLTLIQSLKNVQSKFPVYLLCTISLNEGQQERLRNSGYKIIPSCHPFTLPAKILSNISNHHWRHTFAKLELFSLAGFEKLIYLDADMIVCRNIDHLFNFPHLTFSTGSAQIKGYEDWILPNSGLMILSPKTELDIQIFNTWQIVAMNKPNFGDQDLIHEYFKSYFIDQPHWRISTQYNCFVFLIDEIIKQRNFNFNFSKPNDDTIYILHFALRNRPWQMSLLSQIIYLLKCIFQEKRYERKAFCKYRSILKTATSKGHR